MAIEARKTSNLFSPSQLITNRDFIKTQENTNNPQIDFGFPMNSTRPHLFSPYGQSSLVCHPISSMNNNNKSDSDLTYNVVNPTVVPRKRLRDDCSIEPDVLLAAQKQRIVGFDSLLDQDVLYQIQQQQSDINRFVAQHTEKMKAELQERRRQQTRMLTSALETAIAKKLREKEDEIQRVGKLNWVLQERVKSLYAENQVWRDLAHSNEATATNLRSNLEQVLAGTTAAAANDAGSSCGSCECIKDEDEIESHNRGGRTSALQPAHLSTSRAEEARRRAVVGTEAAAVGAGCRSCGEREATVLLLPCRHLCLCTVCGSALLQDCPVCGTAMNASVHVNMS